MFLIVKGVMEILDALGDEPHEQGGRRASASFALVIAQIAIIDIVFSLDSVITAVGMVNILPVMVAAIVLAVLVMIFIADPIGEFIDRNPTIKMLALAFIILVGVALLCDGIGVQIGARLSVFRDGVLGRGRIAEPAREAAPSARQARARRLEAVCARKWKPAIVGGLARRRHPRHSNPPGASRYRNGGNMRAIRLLFLLLLAMFMSGCGYNSIQSKDEGVKAAWSEVLNQYQRRADLVPNLVNTVKGYAQHEEEVFIKVTEARAQVGKITLSADDLGDAAKMKQFQAAQGELSGALSRLMAISENYPQLKADGLFQNLQAQLEGTENRITVARNRYIKAVQDYNVTVRSFPNNLTAMMFGYKEKPNFSVENEKAISTAPKVDFNKPAAAPAQPPPQPEPTH